VNNPDLALVDRLFEFDFASAFVNLPETRRSRFGEELNAEKMKKAI
jgi:hypothetical protein